MQRISKSFGFALKGFKYAFKTQLNFKVHVFAALLAVIMGIWLKLNKTEWLWIAFAIALVLILELINTAIELLVDLASPAINPKAGAIKDMLACAVLLAAVFASIVGLFVFGPKFFA